MSRQAEEAHERWMSQHRYECKRDLVVGAKVYRPAPYGYKDIQEGVITRISTCYYDDRGDIRGKGDDTCTYNPAKKEEHTLYVAKFSHHESMRQTWQHDFFYDRRDAHKDMMERIERHIEDYESTIRRLKEHLETHKNKIEEQSVELKARTSDNR